MASVKLPPFSMRGAVGAVSSEDRTVEVVWTTGAKVMRSGWDGRYYEELSLDPAHVRMGRLNNGAPFLADHDAYRVSSVLGVVESAKLEGSRGTAKIRFARAEDDADADKIFRKIKDGIIQNVSVGYRIHKFEKVEGGEDKTPTYRATDWEPHELSAVPVGADDGAGFRSETANQLNDCVLVTRENEAPQEHPQMNEEELKKQQAAEAKRQAELKEHTERAAAEERKRGSDIRQAVRVAGLGDDLAEKMVNDGTSIDKARELVIAELAARSKATPTEQRVSVTVGDTDADKFGRMAVAALIADRNEVKDASAIKARGFENLSLDPGTLRGYSVSDLARECLERRGTNTRGLSREQVASKAFTMGNAQRSAGYAGVDDFPILLETALYKVLQAGYAVEPDTWSRFCKVVDQQDFRESYLYRNGAIASLDELGENEEFKRKSIPDGAKLAVNLATKGNMIGIGRKLLLNDDMGAFNDLMDKLGRAAKRSVEEDVYALLAQNSGLGPLQADSQPFFHSNRSNVNGTGAALSVAALDADRVVMGQQKDAQSLDYLSLKPAVLLVPLSLGGQARVINAAQFNHDSTKLMQPNMVQNLFRDIIDTPRLSGTRRYLFADPSVAPAIVVSFLRGQREPVLESKAGWNVDGTELKVRFDYKAQMHDPKGAVTNAGV